MSGVFPDYLGAGSRDESAMPITHLIGVNLLIAIISAEF
jgi:hypothetical protein